MNEFTVVLTRTARRQLTHQLPEAVAAAVWEFITGPLRTDPYRVGKKLHPPLEHLLAARRGTYRVLYSVQDIVRVIEVVQIEHRRDAYRT